MTGRWLTAASWAAPVLTLAVWVTAFLLPFPQPASVADAAGWAAPFLVFAAIGTVIVHHQGASRVGWLMVAIGLLQGLGLVQSELLQQLTTRPGWTSALPWLALTTALGPLPNFLLVLLVMTFPNGRLPSRRWRWAVAVLLAGLALVIADQLAGGSSGVTIPATVLANATVAHALDAVTSFDLFALYLLLPVAAVVSRYRSGDSQVREQVKWFAVGVAALLALVAAGGVAQGAFHSDTLQTYLTAAGMIAFGLGIGIAVVRHRLYDVDLVISRGLTYAVLALLATVVYVAVVVGLGSAIGQTSRPNLALSVTATALVAVGFNPARLRVQELANKLVYGHRQTPYESLASFTRAVADGNAARDLLSRMVEALTAGVGARATAAHFANAPDRPAAAWPAAGPLPEEPPDRVVEVRHDGDLLGALSVWMPRGRELNATEERLLVDLAAQAGLVLRNAALTAELERRLAELRASRRRLVTAQDAERRRLERDLHDGAQHDLVAIRMKLGLAEAEAARSSTGLAELLAQAKEETASALENIRALVRGLYPPLLESQGLAAALSAHARRLPVDVEVRAISERFSREVETAVYFCCVEALQNVVKHASARTARVELTVAEGVLRFEVHDDGRGFDPALSTPGAGVQNITDRIEALGGAVEISSGSAGTSISGEVPAIAATAPAAESAS